MQAEWDSGRRTSVDENFTFVDGLLCGLWIAEKVRFGSHGCCIGRPVADLLDKKLNVCRAHHGSKGMMCLK